MGGANAGMTGASGLGELAESQMRDLLFPPTPELIVPQSNLYLPQAGLPAMPEELMGVGGMPEVSHHEPAPST